MDMGPAFAASVRTQAPKATICIDPFHAVKVVTDALDTVRREAWNELRRSGNPEAAHKFKGARWALLKNPTNLSDEQTATLRKLKRRGGQVWRAYTLKEAFRAVFAGDLTTQEVTELIDRWIAKASRSRIDAMVKTAKTIRKHRDGILTAIQLRINKRVGPILHLLVVIRCVDTATRSCRAWDSLWLPCVTFARCGRVRRGSGRGWAAAGRVGRGAARSCRRRRRG